MTDQMIIQAVMAYSVLMIVGTATVELVFKFAEFHEKRLQNVKSD